MAKYHINEEGNPGECKALKQCPFGGEADHFPTKWEAMKHYEEGQGTNSLPAASRKPKKKPVLATVTDLEKITEKIHLSNLNAGEKVNLLFKGNRSMGNEPYTDSQYFLGYKKDEHSGDEKGRALFGDSPDSQNGWEAYKSSTGRWVYGSSAEALKLEAVYRNVETEITDRKFETLQNFPIKYRGNGHDGVFQDEADGTFYVLIRGDHPKLGEVRMKQVPVMQGRKRVLQDDPETKVYVEPVEDRYRWPNL